MRPTHFTATQFTPTQFSTAEEKAQFANQFIRFVQSNYRRTLFTKNFYRRLSMTFGHIAHYDSHGFYEHFFTSPEGQREFVQQTMTYPCWGDATHTYSDVERALQAWLRTSGLLRTLSLAS